jgi:hypothetical protein
MTTGMRAMRRTECLTAAAPRHPARDDRRGSR